MASPSADYSSVPEVVPQLIEALPMFQERGIELVVRPHPVTGSRLPRYRELLDELFAAGAQRGRAKAEDFMWSDVMISDISGVTAEYLFTEKPIILPASERLAGIGKSHDRLSSAYPYAYLWDPATPLVDHLDGLESSDPKRRDRATAAKRMFKGHESLDEAARTFDTALSIVRYRKFPVPLRWTFEFKRRAGPVLALKRRVLRRTRTAAAS